MTPQGTEASSPKKVAAVLFAFIGTSGVHERLTVSEIARTVGRERSQVSRMLKALAQTGLLEQDPEDRSYRLGWPLQVLAAGAGDQVLVRTARPILKALAIRTGEAAFLSVLQGSASLTIIREDSNHSLRAGGWVGRTHPLYYTSSGRALLFDMDPEILSYVVQEELKIPGSGPRAPQSVDEFLSRLKAERAQGFSFANEELEVGLSSLGAPIRDGAGQIVAVVNTSVPTSRLGDRKDELARLTLAAAAAITKDLQRPPLRQARVSK